MVIHVKKKKTLTKYIGAHVSASGGVGNAILNAEAIGANAFALFTRNQRSWVSKPLPQLEIDGFKALLVDRGFRPEMVLPRDDRLKEYIMVNPKATVAAIREATALLLEDGKLKLIGKPNKMKVFKTSMANTKEYGLRSNLDFLLKA